MTIDIISVQPTMFSGFLTESIVARAVRKGACRVNIVDLRDFGRGRWRKVDDRPYGGGPGMLMACGPWFAAVESVVGKDESPAPRVVLTSPAGRRFSQRDAADLSAAGHVVFMCGHYEGFDARIETLATDKFSVGDFVMTGGELAAAAMTDAIVRLLPGVLGGGPAATASESFGADGLLEAPQYTHPPEFRGMRVPDVLLSGDHRRIEAWRKAQARRLTEAERPDLLDGVEGRLREA
ncbi:MAG: tRNA (guanosine(37)-N1)-methyltransferase TrmD [Kiritimatiellae bacterium]|nr:tRNA (guanosine(37)-N1)-methyltransferase TrmD [Kiritimatiellia bacterium]MBQ3343747.1 tRNA (guanosine(37)-N1)-methyltransferase TrmD [Kiritimatiellia bacterium]